MKRFNKIWLRLVIILLVVCVFIQHSSAQTNATASRAPKSWAVVIGINKYPKLPGGQQLMFADKDAAAFAEGIKKVCGENVRTFINQEATLAAIKEAIGNWLARSTMEGDTVYLFFSGHGIVESAYGEAYLLAYDSDANQPFSSALSLRELNYAIGSRVRAGRLLIIADAVRKDFFEPDSGGVATSTTFTRAFNQLAESRPGVATLLASAAGEFSREGQRWNAHSVFTKYLLDAITADADMNRDGAISADEIFNFVSPRVASDTSNKQHPSSSGSALAGIIVSRNPVNLALAKPAEGVKPPAPLVAKAETKEIPKPVPLSPSPATKSQPPVKAENTPSATDRIANNPVKPTIGTAPPVTPTGTTNTPTAPPGRLPAAIETEKKSEPAKPRQLVAEVNKPLTQPSLETTKPGLNETTTPKAVEVVAEPKKVEKPAPRKSSLPTPPTIKSTQPASTEAKTQLPNSALATTLSPPPAPLKSTPKPPVIGTISETAPRLQPTAAAPLPVTELVSAPSPLPSQFDIAIAAGRIVEPRGNNAWEIFQLMNGQAATTADAVRLKPRLIEALIRAGKETISGDVRSDNITDRVEDFKRAGQLFAKGRSLAPENKDLPMLEKLSAAEALLALQFYDEAERALSQMPQSAASENAFGIVYTGKLDYWKAERAYKNAIEMEPNWYAPHYNLAMLYRVQKSDAALAAFEKAAGLSEKNSAVWLALGDEHFNQNHWQQAAEAYRKAVAVKPNDDNLHTKLGHALYSQGLRDEANREYQKAKDLRGRQ